MGEIDNAHDAENQRQPHADNSIERAGQQPVDTSLCEVYQCVSQKLLPLVPARSGNNGLADGDLRRVDNRIFSGLHLGNQNLVLILAIGIEPDRPKRSRTEVEVPDGIPNLGAIQGLSVVDGVAAACNDS